MVDQPVIESTVAAEPASEPAAAPTPEPVAAGPTTASAAAEPEPTATEPDGSAAAAAVRAAAEPLDKQFDNLLDVMHAGRVQSDYLRYRPKKTVKLKDFPISFRVSGKKGDLRWATECMQTHFRGEKLAAVDDSNRPGFGTRIMMSLVGNELQTPVPDYNGEFVGGTYTAFYASNAFGNGLTLKTCQPGQLIRYLIKFEEDCTWEAVLFGKMIDDDYIDPFEKVGA